MIKRFLFLLITIIPIYCYAGTTNKDYVYDIEKDMYYTLDGNVYSGTIQYEYLGHIFTGKVSQGREFYATQHLPDGSIYKYEYAYPKQNTRYVKMYNQYNKLISEYTTINHTIEGKSILYNIIENRVAIIFNFKNGKRDGIAEISNKAGTKWGEILFKQDEPISGFCYESITRKKIKLSNITIQNLLKGGDVICSE